MSTQHNRRQRKKLRLGEFQELGFEAAAKFARELEADHRAALLDAFLEFIEANGMLAAASTSDTFDAYLISGAPHGSATEDDRQIVQTWLAGRPDLIEVRVGELSDAWYPPAEDR
jgi:uncharacterized protein YggL (DUF469 family)